MNLNNTSRIRVGLISGVLICGVISLMVFLFSNSNDGIEQEIQNNFLALETKAEVAASHLINNKVTKNRNLSVGLPLDTTHKARPSSADNPDVILLPSKKHKKSETA